MLWNDRRKWLLTRGESAFRWRASCGARRRLRLRAALGDADHGGTQHAVADGEAGLHHLHHGASGPDGIGHLEHRLVLVRIELLALGSIGLTPCLASSRCISRSVISMPSISDFTSGRPVAGLGRQHHQRALQCRRRQHVAGEVRHRIDRVSAISRSVRLRRFSISASVRSSRSFRSAASSASTATGSAARLRPARRSPARLRARPAARVVRHCRRQQSRCQTDVAYRPRISAGAAKFKPS